MDITFFSPLILNNIFAIFFAKIANRFREKWKIMEAFLKTLCFLFLLKENKQSMIGVGKEMKNMSKIKLKLTTILCI